MSIGLIVTRGLGNGTQSGTIAGIVLDGFISGASVSIPTLSSPAASANGATKVNWSINTDQPGTLYMVLSTSAVAPNVAQIQLGEDSSGLASAYAYNGAMTIGSNAGAGYGLTLSTTYYSYFQGHNGAGDSAVLSGPSVTTAATNPKGIKKARVIHAYGMR